MQDDGRQASRRCLPLRLAEASVQQLPAIKLAPVLRLLSDHDQKARATQEGAHVRDKGSKLRCAVLLRLRSVRHHDRYDGLLRGSDVYMSAEVGAVA